MTRTAPILLTLCGLCLFAPLTVAPGQAQQTVAASTSASAEIAYWNQVKDAGDAGKIKTYLTKFPNGMFYDVALAKYKALGGKMSDLKMATPRHTVIARTTHHKMAKAHHHRMGSKHKTHKHVKAKTHKLKHRVKPKIASTNNPLGSLGHGSASNGGGGGGGGSSSGGGGWGGH